MIPPQPFHWWTLLVVSDEETPLMEGSHCFCSNIITFSIECRDLQRSTIAEWVGVWLSLKWHTAEHVTTDRLFALFTTGNPCIHLFDVVAVNGLDTFLDMCPLTPYRHIAEFKGKKMQVRDTPSLIFVKYITPYIKNGLRTIWIFLFEPRATCPLKACSDVSIFYCFNTVLLHYKCKLILKV